MTRPPSEELAEFLQQHREQNLQPPVAPVPPVQWEDEQVPQEVSDEGLTPEQ